MVLYFRNMKAIKELELYWEEALNSLYSKREIKSLFHLTLEDVLGITKTMLLSNPDLNLSLDASAQLNRVLERLKLGEPYQYIVGFTYFDELEIKVDPGVLIPRPETEELVHWVLDSIHQENKGTIIDWCTGSGCIALALKHHLNNWEVHGIDVSLDALKIAKLNSHSLNISVEWHEDSALEPSFHQKVDVIVSNPPYIPFVDKAEMHQNVLKFEPDLALFVPDNDPLLFYKAIADYALKNLNDNGVLFFELHERFAQETKSMLEELGFNQVQIKLDLQGKQRMLKAQMR